LINAQHVHHFFQTNTGGLEMKKITIKRIALASLTLAFMIPSLATAGNLEPTAAPESAASAVYKTDDVYNRLYSGATGAKRAGAFTEPSAGPADGVGKTLDEIMAAAPAADNTNGAAQADVKTGKTFWGLRTDGTWGLKAGTAPASSPYPAPVPKSGQTTCYDVTTNLAITCGATTPGQDGALQKGVALPTPRFTINMNGATPDGTVTDNKTGLIWLANANCLETVGGIAKAAGTLTWPNALTWSNNLSTGKCGLTDSSAVGAWRLPNKEELASLVNAQYYNPSLSNTAGTAIWTAGNPFSGVQSSYYWSSTTYVYSPAFAWGVLFDFGGVGYAGKAYGYYVWPVRSGQ
jgi:hypothetical protein